jgi:DNA-directed RNA polymerase subunit N (RpoN/RPB10)
VRSPLGIIEESELQLDDDEIEENCCERGLLSTITIFQIGRKPTTTNHREGRWY